VSSSHQASVLQRFLLLFMVSHICPSFFVISFLTWCFCLHLRPLLGHMLVSFMWKTFLGILCSFVLCFVYSLILLFINSFYIFCNFFLWSSSRCGIHTNICICVIVNHN
jgi:hypothetical protein